ncbi:MAG: hypothetical protein A2068_12770 [Ignavibacteria bacterium GWB2_35_6b]|nr:MAG: hypothetical protein A2068_12770 [Ignavibacteria bacterium GWB2_35_6b]
MNAETLRILRGDSGEEQLARELNVAKFRSYAKDKFLDYVKYDIQYLDLLKESARHTAFNLPELMDEFFLRMDAAPYFWILDSNILAKAEETFRVASKNVLTAGGNYGEIKKFYLKWLTQNNEKEKQYFALSTINLIERNINANNFLKYLLNASIYAYDNRIFSPEKAESLLEKSLQVIETADVPDNIQREFLYLVNLYYGFIEMRIGNIDIANAKFETAQQFKHNGMTAVLYNALSEKILGNRDKTQELLTKVITFDKHRFSYAIENNSLPLFNFFFQNANIYNIFAELQFADMLPQIEMIIAAELSDADKILHKLNKMIQNLSELRMQKYYTDEVKNQLIFLETFLVHFKENKNILSFTAGEFLINKFKKVIDEISAQIESYFLDAIESQLAIYDYGIEDSNETMKKLKSDVEDTRLKLKKGLDATIEKINQHHKMAITNLEYKMEHLESNKKFDPASAFNNSMVFNSVISLLVFIIGGFIGGFLDTVNESFSVSEIFSMTVIAGIKWGGITFLLGLLISFVSSASAIWERANEKLKIQRDINYLKNHREKEIQHVKSETEKSVKSFEKNFENRIEALEKKVESLKEERVDRFNDLKNEARDQIDRLKTRITTVFQM